MNKPNLTLAAFCANLAYVDITDRVKITLYIPKGYNKRGDQECQYITLEAGATGRNLAIYGHWYVTSIDVMDDGFDLVVEENPPF